MTDTPALATSLQASISTVPGHPEKMEEEEENGANPLLLGCNVLCLAFLQSLLLFLWRSLTRRCVVLMKEGLVLSLVSLKRRLDLKKKKKDLFHVKTAIKTH